MIFRFLVRMARLLKCWLLRFVLVGQGLVVMVDRIGGREVGRERERDKILISCLTKSGNSVFLSE